MNIEERKAVLSILHHLQETYEAQALELWNQLEDEYIAYDFFEDLYEILYEFVYDEQRLLVHTMKLLETTSEKYA